MADARLTRRRSADRHHETWHIDYDDMHVGTIGRRAGLPVDVDQWGLELRLLSRPRAGQHQDGSAESFEMARGLSVAAAAAEDPRKRV
jgi:hypothetical protein